MIIIIEILESTYVCKGFSIDYEVHSTIFIHVYTYHLFQTKISSMAEAGATISSTTGSSTESDPKPCIPVNKIVILLLSLFW